MSSSFKFVACAVFWYYFVFCYVMRPVFTPLPLADQQKEEKNRREQIFQPFYPIGYVSISRHILSVCEFFGDPKCEQWEYFVMKQNILACVFFTALGTMTFFLERQRTTIAQAVCRVSRVRRLLINCAREGHLLYEYDSETRVFKIYHYTGYEAL